MPEDAEKRFERAMDRLFSSPATPASSSAGAASLAKGKRRIQMGNEGLIAPKASPTSRLGGCPPRAAGTSPAYSILHINPHPVCRPWERGDFFRRLATFRSMTWFGKPEVVGPVNCARKGWVNVDVDLIACESCDAKLSFSSPPAWSQQQVESAAAAFSEKLDIGHKALCPWKGNMCSENLVQFPPTPVEALVEGFKDRCDALYQLSALPVIKKSAIDHLRLLKGPQIDQLLAQPVPSLVLPVGIGRIDAESTGEDSYSAALLTYFQAQRLISLCGWEPRLLPYIVDYEADSTQSSKRTIYATAHDEVKLRRHSDPGPIVVLRSRTEQAAEKDKVQNKLLYSQQSSDVKSAVLDCNLCGASVGLWLFSTVARPSMWTSTQLGDVIKIGSEPSACGFSAASGIERGDGNRIPEVVKPDGKLEAITSSVPQSGSRTGVLDLKLTIAGGPPPTRLNSFGSKPSCYSPNPVTQPRIPQLESSEMGKHQDQEVEHQVCNTDEKRIRMMLHTDKAGCINLGDNVVDDSKGCTLQSLQYEHTGDLSSTMVVEKEGDGMSKRKRKGNDRNGLEDKHFLEHSFRDLPRYSSVDAMDTSFHSRRENSAESVEMPQEVDSQGTAISGYNNDLVAQAQQSTSAQAETYHSQRTVLPEVNRVKKVRDAAEVTRNIKQTSEVIFEEDGHAPEVVLGENQEVLLTHVKQQFGSGNDAATIEGNSGESQAKRGKNIEALGPLKNKRIADGDPMEAFRADGGPESSVGAISAEERTFDSSVLWEPETNEFDPVTQHRHFCPWINGNSTRERSTTDNQYGGKCGWQLALDALETSPVMAESESASSIYNANPLASVRKIFGKTQTSQKKSK